MYNSIILSAVTFVYFFASCFYIASWIFNNETTGKIATWINIIAIIGNATGLIIRWIESYFHGIGHAPLSNLYESLIFFAFTISCFYLYIEFRQKNRIFGSFISPIAFLAMAYASLPGVEDRIQPLVPALKSNWLIAHVITCFIGYAAFAIAFGISLMYLIERRDSIFARLPEKKILDEINHEMVMFGFLFLTIGIITGAVWANSAWGRYWGWDPKETWSLITWFIYATLLHTKFMRGWSGKRIAFLSIIGFMAVIFTYFGVNLLSGLHSYGKG
ncbi:MAG: c-type cytochrome biogenesis protein CcsB [Desulfobacterales bacterium]|nr:c-type cytochrome biogenesis protein CcsB [Desulfobacterales bacterium]